MTPIEWNKKCAKDIKQASSNHIDAMVKLGHAIDYYRLLGKTIHLKDPNTIEFDESKTTYTCTFSIKEDGTMYIEDFKMKDINI